MGTKKNKNKTPNISKGLNEKLLSYASTDIKSLYKELNSGVDGLEKKDYEQNLETFGPNILTTKKETKWYQIVFNAFINPFSVILLIIAILQVVFPGNQDWPGFAVIATILIVSGSINLFQDIRSSKASSKLKEMIKTTTAVLRSDGRKERPIEDVVPGDIIYLAAGDMIPADLRIISAKDLFINQSSMTGESEPVEKMPHLDLKKENKSALSCNNLCFMGTSVSSGSAIGIVLSTGNETFFGKIAKSLTRKKVKTSFDKGIASVSWMLIITMLILTILVMGIQLIQRTPLMDAAMFGLALMVGLTPEMLPMIITMNLSKQAYKMSKEKTIVKNISSIQSFGAMDVLCTDKTGTLTEDKIILERHIGIDGKSNLRVLEYGYLNSYFQTGLKNLLDVAIIEKGKQAKLDNKMKGYEKIDEIPFDFNRRRMSVIIKKNNGENFLVTKGAVEEILSISKHAEINGKIVPLDEKIKNRILKTVADLNKEGMRVIAITTNFKPLPKDRQFTVQDESNMVLLGYVALLDPPKMSSMRAIKDLQKKGVEVKVLTGDNVDVSRYICKQVGINVRKVLSGDEVGEMDDNELKTVVMDVQVFAKLSPEQKARVVRAIKSNRHVVGFMGDGINDATAMKAADISISVDTAVDIAKETADIILLEKDLTILGLGCVEGRRTYANISKYIKMSVSSAFGNVLSMLIASIWFGSHGQPMVATQILILNLLSDISLFAIPWDNVDEDFVKHPKDWNAKSILKFMLFMGPISTIFDLTTFAIMLYGFKWDVNVTFQTGWFFVSLLTQLMVVIVLRTSHIPFFQSNPSLPVFMSLGGVVCVGFIFCSVPGLNSFGFSSLIKDGPQFFGYSLLIALGYLGCAQLGKIAYKKIFNNSWL